VNSLVSPVFANRLSQYGRKKPNSNSNCRRPSCVARGIAAVLDGETDILLVAEAGNGLEAIDQFRTHRPDVTLMDLQMPEMSGTDAIVAIRKDFPDARIIVLATYSGDAQAVRAFKAGAAGYQ
jgi:DNA-binding NarL/FixJ family response regulator